MIWDRKLAFDTISRVLAITRLDIEHHQAINDHSLNIHGEDYFRDVFNMVYDSNFVNANVIDFNSAYIDLVDHKKNKVIQITTTRTPEKIRNSLKYLTVAKYKGYDLSIYYLLDKANTSEAVREEIEKEYPVKLKGMLKDYRDLVKDISALKEKKLIHLARTHFAPHEEKYTDEKALDLVYKKLLKEKGVMPPPIYDDDLGSIDVNKKITVNKVNARITAEILTNLDYTSILESIDNGDLGTSLRQLVVHSLYKGILIEQLKTKEKKSVLALKETSELQEMAMEFGLDFSKLIVILHQKIEGLLLVKDYNAMNIAWILVAFFFEICDVGVKKNGIAN